MKKIGVIIPTRNERPPMLKHLLDVQIPSQVFKPDKIYLIDSSIIKPQRNIVDLAERLIAGIDMAIKDCVDLLFIMEDDDYYPETYLIPLDGTDFIGIEKTVYYHLLRKRYITLEHKDRSSLFCTAFSLCAGNGFALWIQNNWQRIKYNPYLDLYLWNYAKEYDYRRLFIKPKKILIGIKHGIGLCGGNAHTDNFQYNRIDYGYNWLRSKVRPESFQLYMDITTEINNSRKPRFL
jgi:hypothetical protein